jgi:hypothetical protein
MENMESILMGMVLGSDDCYYGEGKRVEWLWEDEEYGDEKSYDDVFVGGWKDLKNRLRKGNIVYNGWFDVEMNFELRGEDILMWFIEGKDWED